MIGLSDQLLRTAALVMQFLGGAEQAVFTDCGPDVGEGQANEPRHPCPGSRRPCSHAKVAKEIAASAPSFKLKDAAVHI